MRIFLLILAISITGCGPRLADSIEKGVREAKDGPIDNTGRTSIVIEWPNGDWCELRGPGRFAILDSLPE